MDVTDGSRDVFPAATSGGAAIGGRAINNRPYNRVCEAANLDKLQYLYYSKACVIGTNG